MGLQPRSRQPLRRQSPAFLTSPTRTSNQLAVPPITSTGRALESLELPSVERDRVFFASLLTTTKELSMPTILASSVSLRPSVVSILLTRLSAGDLRSHLLTTKRTMRLCTSTREPTASRRLQSL